MSSNVGKNNPFYGKKHSLESRRKMSLSRTGKKMSPESKEKNRLAHLNEKHNGWKGDKVGYHALHTWIRKNLPKPELCPHCNKKPPQDVANMGIYNREFKNWQWLCKSCHMKYDKQHLKRKRDSHGRFT